jgi:rubrerythrin
LTYQDDLIEFIKKQIVIENQIVDSLNTSLEEIENPVVKGVLRGISLDSVKHAEMYGSAITLLTGLSKALTQKNLDTQIDLVQNHIDIELKLIKKLRQALPKVKNEKVKLILNAILSDEARHHILLKRVLAILVEGETITDDDWWDLLWKNVPFHGAPGG